MEQFRATSLALFGAPLVSATLLGAGMLAGHGGIATIPICYAFTLGTTIVMGLPAFLLLRRRALIRWWMAGLVGFLGGAMLANRWGAAAGAAEGLTFWLIWRLGDAAAHHNGRRPKD